jgi:hypothetical protein
VSSADSALVELVGFSDVEDGDLGEPSLDIGRIDLPDLLLGLVDQVLITHAHGSPTRHGREEGDNLAIGHCGVQPVEEADVVFGHEDVDETPRLSVLSDQPLTQIRVPGDEVVEGISYLPRGHLYFG